MGNHLRWKMRPCPPRIAPEVRHARHPRDGPDAQVLRYRTSRTHDTHRPFAGRRVVSAVPGAYQGGGCLDGSGVRPPWQAACPAGVDVAADDPLAVAIALD